MVRLINVCLALLVSAAMTFGLVELGLRLIGFGPPSINTEFDPHTGWRGQPKSRIVNETSEFEAEIELDALGLRDDFDSKKDAEKPVETFRVLCLGDSFVGGYTVNREHLFVDMLERAWSKELRGIDVVNAGVQGYSTDQQLVWLQRHGADFAPDLVIAFPYENDIWWNGQETYVGEPKPAFDEAGIRVPRTLEEPEARGWFGRTAIGNLGRLFQDAPRIEVDGRKLPVEWTSRLTSPPEETLRAERVTKALIGQLSREAERLGARFAVCPIPTRASMVAAGDGPFDPERPTRVFKEAAEAVDTPVLRVADALRTAQADGLAPYYEKDFHLSPTGNAVLAEAVYQALDRLALVPLRRESSPTARPDHAALEGLGGGFPKWPFVYLLLTLGLGALYAKTYPDEGAPRAFAQVAALLAVVFAVALGGAALLGSLSPTVGKLVLVAALLALFTFIAYKLGDRLGTILEVLKAFTLRGHWYLLPLLCVLLTVGSLLIVAASSPLVAPFIYTLF